MRQKVNSRIIEVETVKNKELVLDQLFKGNFQNLF